MVIRVSNYIGLILDRVALYLYQDLVLKLLLVFIGVIARSPNSSVEVCGTSEDYSPSDEFFI